MIKDEDTARIKEVRIAAVEEDGVTFAVKIDPGTNRSADPNLGSGGGDRLIQSLTQQDALWQGDEVIEPTGSNSNEPAKMGTVLHHDLKTGRVAWTNQEGSPLISERNRLIRTRYAQ